MSDQQHLIQLNVKSGIAYVALNRPQKHNALDLAMFEQLAKVIKRIKNNRTIRVVIVSGNGESFCSGLDVKSLLTDKKGAVKLLWKWLPGNANLAQQACVGWRQLNVPVIMALHGKCWGGGMQIALGGDVRIASPDCSLSIMESRWGLIPDMGGTLALSECVGADHAIKLASTSETLNAQQAQQLGLITQVADDPLQAANQLAEQLIQRSPDTNRLIKAMYHKIWCPKQRRILAAETINQIKILMGKNQRIAVQREKSKDVEFKL
ncbi:crotonase/enoyl-CoA hydratase family protein [Neptunicella marina]|uniref:Crotonase/enoyl-CoA hydratase family protein n=1 Tax=Neptunicella marina TaxID=2125989 RepID=A0A8J6IUZ2_9ALTE|nr:crotonase/enoyl-CoA hydratase family protein [Neptunicella marina]MBC3766829.1 crotonase/enoyl-CoA hydratase family protein [Neptunicella marina]